MYRPPATYDERGAQFTPGRFLGRQTSRPNRNMNTLGTKRRALTTTDILRGAWPLDDTPTLSTDSQPAGDFPPRRTPAHRRTSTLALQLWIYKILLLVLTFFFLGGPVADAAHGARLHSDTAARSRCSRLVSGYPWRAEELAAGFSSSATLGAAGYYNFPSSATLGADGCYNFSRLTIFPRLVSG